MLITSVSTGVPGGKGHWRHWDGLLPSQPSWGGCSGIPYILYPPLISAHGYVCLFSRSISDGLALFCISIVSTGDKWSTWDRLLLSPWLPLCWQSAQERLGSLAGDLRRNQTGLEYLQRVCGCLGLCYISQGQNNFAHWSTQTFYLNAIKIYFLFACKTKQNGVLLLCFLIVYMSFWNHIKYIHWTWFDQEALGANVALEDINRTALVRLKQVGFNPISYFFHKVIIRAWKNLARASHTKFPPRTQRRTLRTAAWVLLTGLRCRNDQYFCTNGHWFDGTLLLHVLQNFQNFAHEASQTSKIIHTEKGLGQ